MENVFDEWLANYDFYAYDLFDYKYLGVACSCSSSGTVCVFMFASEFNGREITNAIPKFVDLTSNSDCAT
jgi:hypothetical protein